MGWFSPWELLILLFVVLLFFGPKRLPDAGRGLGKGLREFKNAITGKDDSKESQPKSLTPTPPSEQDAAN